jgi:hypothetical protein
MMKQTSRRAPERQGKQIIQDMETPSTAPSMTILLSAVYSKIGGRCCITVLFLPRTSLKRKH